MPRVLHVVGSPRGEQSASNAMAQAFLEAHAKAHKGVQIDVLDVWAEAMPPFAGQAAAGKLKAMSGVPLPPDEQAAFDLALTYIDRLKRADKVVVSTGMWNFSVPYQLKHWVDLVMQSGHTFGFDPMRGYYGLLKGRPVQLLLATGADYSETPMKELDQLTPFLRGVFGFMGFEDIRVLTASCMAYPPEVQVPALERAVAQARQAGAAF